MSDIGLIWGEYDADLLVQANDLFVDDSLETAIVISLFTDRRAEPGDRLPDDSDDLRGWWGDAFPDVEDDQTGSRLWLLSREKQMQEVVLRAEEYARQALQWIIDDRVADRIDVTAEIVRTGVLGIGITIYRPTGQSVAYRYNYAWAAQEARRA